MSRGREGWSSGREGWSRKREGWRRERKGWSRGKGGMEQGKGRDEADNKWYGVEAKKGGIKGGEEKEKWRKGKRERE